MGAANCKVYNDTEEKIEIYAFSYSDRIRLAATTTNILLPGQTKDFYAGADFRGLILATKKFNNDQHYHAKNGETYNVSDILDMWIFEKENKSTKIYTKDVLEAPGNAASRNGWAVPLNTISGVIGSLGFAKGGVTISVKITGATVADQVKLWDQVIIIKAGAGMGATSGGLAGARGAKAITSATLGEGAILATTAGATGAAAIKRAAVGEVIEGATGASRNGWAVPLSTISGVVGSLAFANGGVTIGVKIAGATVPDQVKVWDQVIIIIDLFNAGP